MARGFQSGAFQTPGFQQLVTVTGVGGGSSSGKRGKKYIVRKGDRLLVFKDEADALTVLAASNEPQEIEAPAVEKPARRKIVTATKRAEEQVPIVQIEELARSRGEDEAVRRMLAQAQYAALMALVQRMQDEEDVELLLMAA